MNTQTLIDTYYAGLAKRGGWDAALADDFAFTAGNAGNGSQGKASYAEVLRQFGRMFDSVDVKHSIVDGDHACVIASYGAISPSGSRRVFDIAEVWKARDGKLASLTIYFDTAGWKSFMAA
jgi:ketosteroid isomerase-like protein